MVDEQLERVSDFTDSNRFWRHNHRIVKFMENKGIVYCQSHLLKDLKVRIFTDVVVD